MWIISFFSLPVLMTTLSPNANVFVSDVDLFDYRSGEPPPEYRTILRVIDVSQYF